MSNAGNASAFLFEGTLQPTNANIIHQETEWSTRIRIESDDNVALLHQFLSWWLNELENGESHDHIFVLYG